MQVVAQVIFQLTATDSQTSVMNGRQNILFKIINYGNNIYYINVIRHIFLVYFQIKSLNVYSFELFNMCLNYMMYMVQM